ncbi:acriflavin resistance protein [Malaciobacter molluscorum LMG 25693]|uniref:Acriflavin resistance protein n=1 Tax=Malaciobacter molluscorum LMG 25693 TaxID=870501 RepID=A0A2G1DKZ9_9BACT|nr:efflux RND transporter permease subunit [Malaciobacter molluscorum]AXX92571.1 RND family efflux system, inner membrane transporter, AcrB family [Malaciobacter molluscorum LMG 25693]PHO18996.1 acriflavin resistance protein [Malaciobacter molluscorum LMG 25693]
MIKSLIEFFLRKPVLNHMLLFFLFVLSIFSYLNISKEIFPPASLDAVIINGTYAGASSDLLDKIAVEDIEDELLGLSEAKKISSTIKNGFFTIQVDLKDGENPNLVVDDVKDIITQIKTNLPTDMDEPTVKTLEYTFPLITVSLFSKNNSKTKEQLLDIADDVKSTIMQLKDLSEVTVFSKTDKQLLVVFNEDKIKALGLNKVDVINAVSKISSIFPVGIIKDTKRHYYLSTFNGEKDINNIKNIILNINTKKIYLKDIAEVSYQFEDVNTISHYDAKRNIAIGVNKGFEGDSIELVKKIKQISKDYEQIYPDIEFDTYIDTSIWIKNRLNTVVSNILFGLILLFIALLFFINVRIAIVIAIGIPTSFMIGLIGAEYLGYSLNMISLLGALIALGMLVDEAIVVGENIYRHMEMGKSRFEAALDGAYEMYPAVLTATATTIFAFLPILIMSGETGKFMQILPIMITILLLSSLFEAFLFLPLHSMQILKVSDEKRKSHKVWDFNKRLYSKILHFFLKGRYLTLLIMIVGILVLTFILFKTIKFQFLPTFDTTQIYINGSVGVGKKIEQTEQIVFEIEKLLTEKLDMKTEVSSVTSVIGMKLDGKNQPINEEFYFQTFVNLKERAPQNFFDKYINPFLSPKYDSTDMIRVNSAQILEERIKKIINKNIDTSKFDELKIFTPKAGIVKNDIELAISGENKKVQKVVKQIEEKLSSIKGVSNIADDALLGNFELKFKVNKYGQQIGVDEQMILNQLKPFYSKATYSKMFDKKGIVEIVFQSLHKDMLTSLNDFEIALNTGQKVLLKDVADFIKVPAYSQIFKENNKRIVSVTASISKVTSSDVYEQLNPLLDALSKEVSIDIKGEQEENAKVQKEMGEAAIIAIILIFIALVWMFDSMLKPLIIISTIPLSILGVLVGHLLMGINLTMPGLIGVVGLAGVIVNDGIIMMDFIKKAKDLKELEEQALLRLRPILLTSITTVLGLSSLIFFATGQALVLQPMAIALGFGILWATILNLYYVPMVYRLIYLKDK